MFCPVDIVSVDPPEEPEKKKEELVEVVVNASSVAVAVGPSKEPKKEDELRKEEPTKQEELVEEVVNASSRAAAVGPSKEPKKKGEEQEEEEQKKQEGKKKGEELITDVKEDPRKTFRAQQMKKAVLKLELHDAKTKTKAMKTVSGLPGVDSISMDFNDKKMTVTGDIDPVHIVAKLRQLCHTEIITVGPAKEPAKKKEEPKKKDPADPLANYLSYHPQMPQYYHVSRVEDNQNACVIS